MALAVTLRFDLADQGGQTSFTKIRVQTGMTIAQYIEGAQAFAQLIADINNGVVTGASVNFSIDLSGLGLKTIANILADVYEKARFQFNTAVAGLRAKFSLPTLDENKVGAGGDTVLTSDPDVAALISAFEDGIAVTGPATIQPTDDRENDITSLQFAKAVRRRKNV